VGGVIGSILIIIGLLKALKAISILIITIRYFPGKLKILMLRSPNLALKDEVY
jgi:hypothetical protein